MVILHLMSLWNIKHWLNIKEASKGRKSLPKTLLVYLCLWQVHTVHSIYITVLPHQMTWAQANLALNTRGLGKMASKKPTLTIYLQHCFRRHFSQLELLPWQSQILGEGVRSWFDHSAHFCGIWTCKGSKDLTKSYLQKLMSEEVKSGCVLKSFSLHCVISDMVASLGETTGYFAIQQMRRQMKADPVGRQILELVHIL